MIKGFDSGFGKLGIQVSHAGDIDGDGFDDVVVGSQFGKSFVIYGKEIPNSPPVVDTPIEDITVNEDEEVPGVPLQDLFSDPDGSIADISAVSFASEVTLAIAQDTLSFTVDANYFGNVTITVTATDNLGVSASDQFTINILPVNDAPELANPVADLSTEEDSVFTFTIPDSTFFDIEGDELTYTVEAPDWIAYDGVTTLSGTPTNDEVGQFTIVLTATDTDGASVQDDFDLEVLNTNDAPSDITLSNNEISEELPAGTTIGILSTSDVDEGDAHIYSLSGIDASFFQIDQDTLETASVLEFEVKSNYEITIIAQDSEGASIQKDFTILLTEVILSVDGPLVEIRTFPNPVKDRLVILSPERVSYKITSLSGSIMQVGELSSQQVLDFSTFDRGIYLLILNNNHGTSRTIKLLLE